MIDDHSQAIAEVCEALTRGEADDASRVARQKYPFLPSQSEKRRYTERQMTRLFFRDGFVDRYSGKRLVFPGTLRLLSKLLPSEFPAHRNWKMSETHIMFWELFPTVDHVVPVARGGSDHADNWVTASMLRNSAKSNWTLEELEWKLVPPGDAREWDGLTSWYLGHIGNYPELSDDAYLRRWRLAAADVVRELQSNS